MALKLVTSYYNISTVTFMHLKIGHYEMKSINI